MICRFDALYLSPQDMLPCYHHANIHNFSMTLCECCNIICCIYLKLLQSLIFSTALHDNFPSEMGYTIQLALMFTKLSCAITTIAVIVASQGWNVLGSKHGMKLGSKTNAEKCFDMKDYMGQ